MPRIIISITDLVKSALHEMASEEFRDVKAMAAFLIQEGLVNHGYIDPPERPSFPITRSEQFHKDLKLKRGK